MLKHVESLVDCQISSTPCCESLTPSPAIACVHQCMLWCHKKIFPGQSSTSPRDKAPRYARCWENVGRLRRLMGDFVTPRTPHRVFKAQHAQHALNSVISSLSNLCPILSHFVQSILTLPATFPGPLTEYTEYSLWWLQQQLVRKPLGRWPTFASKIHRNWQTALNQSATSEHDVIHSFPIISLLRSRNWTIWHRSILAMPCRHTTTIHGSLGFHEIQM